MANKKIQFKLTAVDKTKAAFDKVSRSLKSVGGGAVKAAKLIGGIGLAATGAATAIALLAKKSFDYIDTLGKTSSRTGIATTTLQAFQLAAIESGTSVEQTQKGLEKFARSIGDAGRGLKTQADIFKDLGVSIKNSDGSLKSFENILKETAEGLGTLGSEAERATVLANLFGRAGIQFSEIFRNGSEGLDGFIDRAEKLGIILDEKTIRNVEKFNDTVSVIGLQLGAVKNQIFAAFVPALQAIATELSNTLTSANEASGGFQNLGIKIAVGVLEGLKQFNIAVAGLFDGLVTFGINIQGTFAVVRKSLLETQLFTLQVRQSLFGLFTDLGAEINIAKFNLMKINDEIFTLAESKDDVGSLIETAKRFNMTLDEMISKILQGGEEFLKLNENGQAGLTNLLSPLEKFNSQLGDVKMNLENVVVTSMKKFEDTIIDGLKNGKLEFKAFADFVVEQLLRIAIQQMLIKPITGRFESFFEGLSFDGGGYTGSGSRAGGIDGKGGFPAILHPNETVIDHTKGQGMGATVNFNISTVDAAGFDQLLASRKGLITTIINNAMNNQGKMGVV